jgi:hypothetical protein
MHIAVIVSCVAEVKMAALVMHNLQMLTDFIGGISLLPTTYKILSNILLSRLIPYAEEIIGDQQCGF